jgi:hypothetical protein
MPEIRRQPGCTRVEMYESSIREHWVSAITWEDEKARSKALEVLSRHQEALPFIVPSEPRIWNSSSPMNSFCGVPPQVLADCRAERRIAPSNLRRRILDEPFRRLQPAGSRPIPIALARARPMLVVLPSDRIAGFLLQRLLDNQSRRQLDWGRAYQASSISSKSYGQ